MELRKINKADAFKQWEYTTELPEDEKGLGIFMFNKFILRGNVSGAIRSDDEMASVDKEAADKSFKNQKKKLDLFLQQKGFVKYKTNSYARNFQRKNNWK